MTLKEKYDANMEFIAKLRTYCDNHTCKECAPSNTPKCDLRACEDHLCSRGICFDNYKKIMEYEPPIDWSKISVDTKIYVKDYKNDLWEKRHFSHCTPDGKVHAFHYGTTSFTSVDGASCWNYAKLAEVEDDK